MVNSEMLRARDEGCILRIERGKGGKAVRSGQVVLPPQYSSSRRGILINFRLTGCLRMVTSIPRGIMVFRKTAWHTKHSG